MKKVTDWLLGTTTRLTCDLGNGKSKTGTGFFFNFAAGTESHVPVIVTNRHVIQGCQGGQFLVTRSDREGRPIAGDFQFSHPFHERDWIQHPDPEIDLAILPIGQILEQWENHGITVLHSQLTENLIYGCSKVAKLSDIEEILMIGYPNGIWDQYHNAPILRRGITATSVNRPYNNQPFFLIDCACFPGSSGSPVFLYDNGSYVDENGNTYLASGPRVILLGVLFAGPQHTAPGEVQTINIPLAQGPIVLSQIPNNLGFVIEAKKILDFWVLLGFDQAPRGLC
ncbi:S1 family peptidase [Schauerella aestuarii]|uniref:S1 family peptidase n=1 Tax=Schauerella aestuarii TaxID=2511204 RepID=UPI00136BEF38|nr:serine protease [Achromobacter aestuarii]MYZ41437.1 serine protease [Achromobacter aestuarii]